MERRTFLKAAVLAGATPAAAWAPDRPVTLVSLIRDYEAAMKINVQAWATVAALEDSPAMVEMPDPRIQISRQWKGYDQFGGQVYEPIYAYSVDEIEELSRTCMNRAMLLVADEAGRQQVTATFAAKTFEKVERLTAMQDECRRIEDGCGYTSALEAAMNAAARTRDIGDDLLNFVPATLEEAARQARWIVAELQNENSYLQDRDDLAQVALSAIGRAT